MTDTITDSLPDNTTDKKKSRQDAKVTRLDVRLPNDLHATIEAIAKANQAPTHHITGNIILTPTVVKLIRLGVASLSGDYPTLADISTTTGQVSDNLTPRMETIESEVSILKKQIIRLEDKLNGLIISDTLPVIAATLSDKISDNLTDTMSDILPDNLADLMMDNNNSILPDNLADRVSDIKTPQKTKPVGALTISDLTKKLEKTRQSIEQRRDSEAGLDAWGYQAERVGRNWYYSPIDLLSD